MHALRLACQRQVTNLRSKLEAVIVESGPTVPNSLHDDLVQIMKDNAEVICATHPSGTFGRVFWEAQIQAASVKDSKQMRWDPVMVRWCLYLCHLSSSAYEIDVAWYRNHKPSFTKNTWRLHISHQSNSWILWRSWQATWNLCKGYILCGKR